MNPCSSTTGVPDAPHSRDRVEMSPVCTYVNPAGYVTALSVARL
jgi:hypothetical protein